MTPAEHATEAAEQLALSTQATEMHSRTRYARLAQVHATLAHAAGTGDDYATAEEMLASAKSAPWSGHLIDQALAHATLADRS